MRLLPVTVFFSTLSGSRGKYGVAIVRGVAKGLKITINLPKDTEIIQHPAHTWQRPQSLRPVEDQGYGVDFIVDR
jgi:hypothetical protein